MYGLPVDSSSRHHVLHCVILTNRKLHCSQGFLVFPLLVMVTVLQILYFFYKKEKMVKISGQWKD